MRILDYTADVKNLVLSGLAAVDRLLPRFEGPRRDRNEYLDDTARDLVSLLTELYQLRRFARLGAPHIADLGRSTALETGGPLRGHRGGVLPPPRGRSGLSLEDARTHRVG